MISFIKIPKVMTKFKTFNDEFFDCIVTNRRAGIHNGQNVFTDRSQ
jgi:hypothetical protein